MSTLINDIKYGLRRLAKAPGFTVVAVLTLALGIGACTAMFSLVSAVLLRPLPFHEPERLVWIQSGLSGPTLTGRASDTPTGTMRVDSFLDWRTQAKSFESLAAYCAFFENRRYSLTGSGESHCLRGIQVSQNFLSVLGVQPLLGRSFMEEECVWNGRRAAILSHAFWRQKLGGATDIVGRTVTVNGESVEIVGVLPASANLDALFSPGTSVELLLPFPLTTETARQGNTLFGIGRLQPRATVAQAQEELAVINARLRELNPDRVRQSGGFGFDARIILLEDHIRGPFRPAFVLLSGAVLCVFLIACVNLSNLLLARANARRLEFSVRIALGASRWRLVRQTMTESLLLAFAGCLFGVLVAFLGMVPIASLQAFRIPLLHTTSIDATTLIAAVILACIAALVCGVLPALQLWRRDASEVLHEAGARGGTGKSTAWIRRTLVVSEIALACLLLVGAGLLIRSFVGVLQVNLGFQPEHTVAWRVDTARPFNAYAERVLFYDRLVERISAVPGVESVGLSDTLPLGFARSWTICPKGVTVDPVNLHSLPIAFVRIIDHRCLQTMRIPLRAGRYFDDRDSEQSQKVMIVNEAMACKLWPGQDPIGQTVMMGGNPEHIVVGVVADVLHGLEEAPQPDMYLNFRQSNDWERPELVVRANRAPASFIPDVRAAIKEFDPTLPSNEFTTLDQIVDRAIAPRRLITGMLGSFTSFAILLAAIGLYGVIAYSVGQRTREIGIRLAIGAQRGDVLRLVVGEGLRLAGIGVAVGLGAAFFVTSVLQSQLYRVAPTDLATFGGAGIFLVAVAVLAAWIPARRAAKVDPMKALRCE
jgi:predicted permease